MIFNPENRGFAFRTNTATFTCKRRGALLYIGPVADSSGAPLVGGKTYKITIPKNMPVKQFWSLIVYDRATFAFIYNPLERAGLSTFDMKTMQQNPDGSVTIYLGPNRPPGWNQTGFRPRENSRCPLFGSLEPQAPTSTRPSNCRTSN
jgi:hypothetical protein